MRKTNGIEIKSGLSCLTCELKPSCRQARETAPEQHSGKICDNYVNETQGYFMDQLRAKRVAK